MTARCVQYPMTACASPAWCDADRCALVPAPRDPAAGATPAREETALDPEAEAYNRAVGKLRDFIAFYRPASRLRVVTGDVALTFAESRALLAALRERDAAREDAARLETARTLYRAGLVYGIWLGHTHAPKGVPGEKIDEQVTAYFDARPAARAAAAESRSETATTTDTGA